jgi:hypothetical protein
LFYAVDLPKSAYDHIQQIAEIEDLLPLAIIEQFLTVTKRQPELEIRSPTGVRYVIGESDKRELAAWLWKRWSDKWCQNLLPSSRRRWRISVLDYEASIRCTYRPVFADIQLP